MEKFRTSILLLTALVAISISSIPGSALGGNISISSTPSGAYVILDNRNLGSTPFIITEVSPGPHTIKLSLNVYDDWTTMVNVVDGSTTNVFATLNKTAISVSSTPSGPLIYLDNQFMLVSTPFTLTKVSPGPHIIKLSLNGYDDWTTTVNVVEGSTTTVSATLNKTAISVSSIPSGAYINMDGGSLGYTPTIAKVSPGSHIIKLSFNGYDDWTTMVNVVEGSTTSVSATLSIKSSTQNPVPTMITPIITSPSVTPAPTYTTTPTPIATFASKQIQTPPPFYSGGTTPTNTQTKEPSEPLISKGWLLTILSSVIAGIIVHRITNKQSKK
jgi:hypothetical protein